MRFVPTSSVREGMIAANRIFGKNGELLLNAGVTINSRYIKRLKELEISGIYIDNILSNDMEISDVINTELRHQSLNIVKRVFMVLEKGESLSKIYVNSINDTINDIINKIIKHKHLMVDLIDLRTYDYSSYYHSVNVGILSIIVGIAINLDAEMLHNLGMAALLHDIGNVFIPKKILSKPGKLTDEEDEIMRSHTLKGYEYLKEQFDLPKDVYTGALQHHERVNGTGYPNSLLGHQISLFGKIIAVADVYDAIISERTYRNALVPSEAMEYIMGGSGSLFDPDIVSAFVQKIAPYPIGVPVLISDNRKGIVVENYSDCCLRPKIQIIKHGIYDVEPYFLDLKNDRSTFGITVIGIDEEAS